MPAEIRVPELGESIYEVTVQRWLKQEGDPVAEGEAIVELETEKANVEISAELSGVLAAISVGEGDTAPVGGVLGMLQDEASSPTSAGAPAAEDTVAHQVSEPPLSSPAARRLATEHEIELSEIQGSGPRGRITREDVLATVEARDDQMRKETTESPADVAQVTPSARTGTAPAPAPVSNTGAAKRERREKMTTRRRTIARRLVEAQQTAAMLTTFNEADMSAIMALRKRRNETFQERHGVKLGFMSFFAKAVIGALKQFPYLNAEIDGDEIVLKEYYDLGIAVGVPEGLVVPVVRDADRKTFAQLEREIADLASRAREGRLALPELQGGTFTITNGGVYGSLMSTPILNTPQVGILGMHRIQERPAVVDSEIVARPMMYLALSYDHRIVDGSDAVRFLVAVKTLVEDPEALLLEG